MNRHYGKEPPYESDSAAVSNLINTCSRLFRDYKDVTSAVSDDGLTLDTRRIVGSEHFLNVGLSFTLHGKDWDEPLHPNDDVTSLNFMIYDERVPVSYPRLWICFNSCEPHAQMREYYQIFSSGQVMSGIQIIGKEASSLRLLQGHEVDHTAARFQKFISLFELGIINKGPAAQQPYK